MNMFSDNTVYAVKVLETLSLVVNVTHFKNCVQAKFDRSLYDFMLVLIDC